MEDIPIKVALRIRPLMSKEKTDCIRKISGENQVIVGNDKCFSFDHVFEQLSSQIEIFNTAVLPLLTHFYKGNNATVLAYGQTGSGKTYTMGSSYISLSQELNDSHSPSKITKNNDSDSLGVIPRVFKNLFRHIDELKGANSDAVFRVSCSFVEIYNEEIKDLFTEKKKRISAEHLSVSAEEKISLTINSYAEAIGLLKNASSLRAVGSTLVNEESSRSHAILTINLEQRLSENQTLKSKLQLVDLAGSERQSKTKAEGIRLKEGININKGLLALGNVISVLSTKNADNKPRHVPYRDSKLTRLLKDSLGGDSHTIMIACVSPSNLTVKESLNTLQYADRARKIKNKPKLQKFIISSNKLNEINGSQIEKINEESIYNSSIKHLEIQLKVKENVIIEQSNQINELKTEIEQLKKTLVPKLNGK
jgi:kinesin family protein 4/21/27